IDLARVQAKLPGRLAHLIGCHVPRRVVVAALTAGRRRIAPTQRASRLVLLLVVALDRRGALGQNAPHFAPGLRPYFWITCSGVMPSALAVSAMSCADTALPSGPT